MHKDKVKTKIRIKIKIKTKAKHMLKIRQSVHNHFIEALSA
jgi:hypothetical protein